MPRPFPRYYSDETRCGNHNCCRCAHGGRPCAETERGAILAARHYDVEVLLVGKENVVRGGVRHPHPAWRRLPRSLPRSGQRSYRDAEKGGTGVRSKRDSSLRVALRRRRWPRSMGLSLRAIQVAAMATAKMVRARAGCVPARLAAVFPTAQGTATILIDVGR